MKLAIVLLAAAVAVTLSVARLPDGVRACGPAGPYDFDTFEAENYVAVYAQAIELAAAGMAVQTTFVVGPGQEVIDLRYQGLESGPRGARTQLSTSRTIPPTLFKSIAWIESSYTQASPSVPFGGVGPALRSFDCGYGLGQITTGMANTTGTAAARQALIGTHYVFNIAEGIRILADKWNSAPSFRPIAGQGDPSVLEDWYFAIWSYNGFAFSNHPLNPMRNPLRGGPAPAAPDPGPTDGEEPPEEVSNPIVDAGAASPIYHCFDPSAPSFQAKDDGRPMFVYGDYTYPERVYGCIRYPPKRAPVGSPPGTPATIQFWQAIEVAMPDFTRPEVSTAFAPENFLACEDRSFSGGCPEMDFPTSFPDVLAHTDPTPLPGASAQAAALGAPSLGVEAPTEIELLESASGVSQVPILVYNTGTWIAPFRIRTSAKWIVVRHAEDPPGRTLDGGVAVGEDTEVVTQQASAGPPPRSRVAQDGYVSRLIVTANPALVGTGEVPTGTIWIEPLLGGQSYMIEVTLSGHSNLNLPYRMYLPWVSSEPVN